MRSSVRIALFAALATGCGSQNKPTGEQTAEMQQGADATNTVSLTLAMADALFRFDPDLNPSGTVATNLQTIRNNVGKSDASCATATASAGSGLTVVFSSNCTLLGVAISGTVDVQLSSPAAGTLTVSLTLTSLVVNGWDLAGTADFSTSNGSYLSVNLNLTHAGTAFQFNGTVSGIPGVTTIDGALTVGSNTGTITSVTLQHAACWPNSGTVSMTLSGLAGTLTFDASTPANGQASVVYQTPGGTTKPACYSLPSHGASCAATACSG